MAQDVSDGVGFDAFRRFVDEHRGRCGDWLEVVDVERGGGRTTFRGRCRNCLRHAMFAVDLVEDATRVEVQVDRW